MSCLLAGRDVPSFLKEQMCDFLTTGETQYKTCIYDCVRARTHTHHLLPRKERELVRLRRFSFLRDLIVFWLWLTPLAWLVAAGVIAALRSKSSTLGHTHAGVSWD